MDSAIREVLERGTDGQTVVYSETLDGKYHSSDSYQEQLRLFLESKYAGWTFDAVIATDDFALEFVRRYRDEIWGSVPVVFCGINDTDGARIGGLTGITGVPENLSVEGTIELMRSLFPDRRRLFVLADGSTTGDINLYLVTEALADTDLEVIIHGTTTIESLNQIASQMEDSDLCILIGLVRDPSGVLLSFDESGRVVSQTLPVPVFSLWDFFMGTGIAGGYMASGREQGRLAAQLTQRILSGEDPDSIPVATESPNVPEFDLSVLGPYGIRPKDLPAGSVMFNSRISLWQEYRLEIILTVIAFVLLVAFHLLAYQAARRRGRAARESAESLREKEILLREIHHRVKNNLQVVSSMLNIQSSFLTDETSIGYFQDCRTRIQSMALVHEHLYRSTSLSSIGMKMYMEELGATLIHSMELTQDRLHIRMEIADFSTDLDQAIPLGMLVNELLSNAIKYAYPEGSGEVLVSLVCTNGRVFLEVSDHGVGITLEKQNHLTSLGLELVDALAKQLGGEVRFEDNKPGLRVTFDFLRVLRDFREVKENTG